jgi:hypothetical protein
MAFQIGYFTVNPDAGKGSVDWPWLESQQTLEEQGCVRHLRFPQPSFVVMNGKAREGMIFNLVDPHLEFRVSQALPGNAFLSQGQFT